VHQITFTQKMPPPAATPLTPEQKIVRATKFYRESIEPLIIDVVGNDKPIVFIEERTTINSGADTASKVANYYQEMQLVATLAGHDDFFKNKKIIFIINEGNLLLGHGLGKDCRLSPARGGHYAGREVHRQTPGS
jgi:hydroxyethylthiazole kinase-like sugar kinase family protein